MNDGLPASGMLVSLLRNLPITSPICRMLIDIYVERYEVEDDEGCWMDFLMRKKLPSEFVFAVMGGLARKSKASRKAIKNLCAYHEHPQDKDSIRACPGANKLRS
jgi:hypothetical protein